MAGFVGRERELASLARQLVSVRSGEDRPGRCLLVRGRRRVGKSRLIEEFCARAGVPSVFFVASRQGRREPELFAAELAQSDLPGRGVATGVTPDSWDAALRLLAAALNGTPAVVVVDEFPYLVEGDPSIEATFQKQWDHLLCRAPVLLVVIGSDLAMMEALNTHGRAFFQRGTELVVAPLSPVETGTIVGASDAAAAFDAYLVTGGLPLVCNEWPTGSTMWEYLAGALDESTSAVIVSGERALAAEFPDAALARVVLNQIGAGERTFTNVVRAGGGTPVATVNRALDLLTTKRVVARDVPLSTRPSKEARYRVADPYLRFWLQFIGPHIAEVERGRGDRVLARIRRDWTTWRGRAVEPVVRDALTRLSPVLGLPPADAVGGYWTRTNVPEIDVIGADRHPVATTVAYAGTVKWLERAPLDQRDLARLGADVTRVPGAGPSTPLVAISRSGVTATGATTLGPDDLLAAW
jgi:AAA+ ATPase superfamily predicted ATPase